MRRSSSLALLCSVLLLVLDGCSAEQANSDGGPFKVALLTVGRVGDGGWNQSAVRGLQRIAERFDAEIAHRHTASPRDFEASLRGFAAGDYDLIFIHSSELQDVIGQVAAAHPRTIFVTSGGDAVEENLAPMVFELEQATYVLGHVAALISRTGHLGAIGGVEIPSVASTFFAFRKGAEAARGDVRMSVSYTGSWTDAPAARRVTLAQISQGADVLIHDAGEGSPGFFQAVSESEGVLACGSNRNQNSAAPERILASATLDVSRALLLVAEQVRAGQFEARPIRLGLKDEVVRIEWNHPLAKQQPENVLDRAADLAHRIESGVLVVPSGRI